MKLHFDKKYLDTLVKNIEVGNVHLFLGAGASFGANVRGGDNNILLAKGLATKLAEFAELKCDITHPLNMIYDAACKKKGKSLVNDFIKNILSGCTATWQKIIPAFLWKTIYTTNIDDVINDAIKKCDNPIQNFRYKIFRDPYESSYKYLDDTYVIQLHGTVRRAESGYIFGSKEYATAIRDMLSWHIKYSEDFNLDSFIFVGSQLLEPDLAVYILYRYIMRQWSRENDLNSFLVTNTVDDIVKYRMKENGILCIESTAEDFFGWLDEQVKKRKSRSDIYYDRLPKIAKYTSDINKKAWIIFRNQFNILVEDNLIAPNLEIHDFYNGNHPTWWDIKNNNDAIFSVVNNSLSSLKNESLVIALVGAAGCGKTTSLMRIAFNLLKLKKQIFFFEDESNIDIDAAIKVLKSTKGEEAYVFVDNAAENIDQIDILIKKLNLTLLDSRLNIKFFIAERENRFERVLSGLTACNPDIFEINWLTNGDINRIIDKLTEKDKLRRLRGKSRRKQINFLKNYSDKQLLVAMRELSFGGKFDRIISREYEDITSDLSKRIYAAVTLCHSQGFSISLNVICRAFDSEIDIVKLINVINSGDLNKVVLLKDGRLKTRHVVIAQQLLKSPDLSITLSRKLKADLVIKLMIALAPLISRKELKKGTPEVKLVKRFMDFDHIENVMGQDEVSIERFYTKIKKYYEWNSKYWAQRGLFESWRNRHSDAIDFIEYAVKKDSHWTITTSQAIIYFRASISSWCDNYSKGKDFFLKALEILDQVLSELNYRPIREIKTLFSMFVNFADFWKSQKDKSFFKIYDKYYRNISQGNFIGEEFLNFINEKNTKMMKIRLGLD